MKKIVIIPLALGGLFIVSLAIIFVCYMPSRQVATVVPLIATSTVATTTSTERTTTPIVSTTTPASTETQPELVVTTSSTPTLETSTSTKIGGNVGIANPASTNCKEKGGTLQIKTRGDGGEYGLCYFEDNYACEEWALFRGECPVGGRRTTGYDTEAQRYCAWLGGQTYAQDNAVCTFKDGSTCPDEALYNGTCSPKK